MVKNGGVNIHYWEKKMANKIPENLAKILKEIGETPQTSLWDCHGTWVINHKSLEKIAVRFGIKFDDPVIIESDQKNILSTVPTLPFPSMSNRHTKPEV